MKEHIVREAFSLDGTDYPRGTRLTDPGVLDIVTKNFPHHLARRHLDVAAADAAKAPAKSV